MNIAFKTLTAALLLAGSGSAFAASSVDLTVKGLITPSACTPTLSNGGSVDYGKISAKDLNVDSETSLDSQILQLTVTCDAATLMALDADDNRAGSNHGDDAFEFGLGLINGTEKLGRMALRLLTPIADGVPVRTVSSSDGGVSWAASGDLTPIELLAPAAIGVDAPIPVQVWTADLVVDSAIAPANGLTLTNEAAIDGSATITVHYL
ncbi:hypothetical protein BFW86_04525 [Pseudomonas fluorescens]|nr:hypothetical protein BFW86_04525 [Pseudomonas fluorescens]